MTQVIENGGIAIIGSGLSALGVASALIERGKAVTIIDAGEMLANDLAEAVESLRWAPLSEWDPKLIGLISRNATTSGPGIPRKLAFGSDYVYGHGRQHFPTEGEDDAVSFTFAKGGFTNVWGGAMLPAADESMMAWPFGREALAPFYGKALEILPYAGVADAIETAFPHYRAPGPLPPLAPETRLLLDRFVREQSSLTNASILAGAARLAIQTTPSPSGPACDGCGLCLTGCPRGAIFASHRAIDQMVAGGKATYLGNHVVRQIEEREDEVCLAVTDSSGGNPRTLTFDRVFVAAGTVVSTSLTLNALKLVDRPVRLRESQKFLLPMLWPGGSRNFVTGRNFTLPNALLLVRPQDGHWAQIQISCMNPLVLARLRYDRLAAPLRGLTAPLLGRMAFGWGSLHSDFSATLELTLTRAGRLSVRTAPNPQFPAAVRSVTRLLGANAARTGLYPLSFLNQLSSPGKGNHCGGSFPMRQRPSSVFDSDLLGRPGGLRRTHLVDASVLPSIPGTTLALPAMANAWRIGSETPLAP